MAQVQQETGCTCGGAGCWLSGPRGAYRCPYLQARVDQAQLAKATPRSLPGVAPAPRGTHKRQRSTARAVYHRKRAIDTEKQLNGHDETREEQVLRILAAYWNAKNESPTALELLEWARQQGESLFDVNSIRPRLNALMHAGIVEPRAKRMCRVSGETVATWAVREIGGREPR